ncbi:MAG: fibronectin [candidate division KSB1 bacterium]|nr:fibronectin [candidate division KSB1 bacterium]MDZ7300954.1 fibronectin [candidate division KSB1 bacterium]MDZ7310368.1 fibronectin [candidate division KSB1 bacterium]
MNRKIDNGASLLVMIIFLMTLSGLLSSASAQVAGTERRYIRIGSLQNHVSAYGSERAWNNVYYEGLIWPADYPYQDNAVIRRAWIAAQDFTDPKGEKWQAYALYLSKDWVDISLFPMELKQTAKFELPRVYVDGNYLTALYSGEIDALDPDQIPDRIVNNVVNTSLGLTMTRRVLAFSQQYHDNYFIFEYTFTNTGNVDYDSEIELKAPLKGVRIGWGVRYSVSRDGASYIGDGQSWGKHTWVTKRGENYPAHASDKITEANPIVDWLRCGFCWAGQSTLNGFDNIGGPNVKGNGRLAAPQHAGIAILHVDKSATDKSDDPNQPAVLGWHAGDTYPSVGNLQRSDEPNMIRVYEMLSGKPYQGLGGTNRMDEVYQKTNVDPFTVHNDAGGTNLWICYGPFDLAPGESVRIVEAEGVSGINRQLCESIGSDWLKERAPYKLPDGRTTNDKNEFKNAWVYTGKDSILLTFGRAKRNFDSGYNIPQPPRPPMMFNVQSGGDRIMLTWSASESESEPDFAGYKIFRAVGKPDTTYQEIATLPRGVTQYDDYSAVRGFSYYYYIVAFNDGSKNQSGATNPRGPLHSNRFYTRATEPAYLRRKAGSALDSIRVVPNPYSIKSRLLQYPGEPDKITFLDIPAYCTIKIYTERGDLIQTIEHTNGTGDEAWNSITSSRQVVVSGVYIAHFEVTKDFYDSNTGRLLYRKGETAVRKFVIIR